MPFLIVPSDISLLERKFTYSRRKLSFFEKTGFLGVIPKLSSRNTKLDKASKKDILTRYYNVPHNISSSTDLEILEILKTRQEHIRREVLANNFAYGGSCIGFIFNFLALRHYSIVTKCIILPFSTLGSCLISRCVGDYVLQRSGSRNFELDVYAPIRSGEFKRDQFLGNLPAKQYYS